MIRQVRLARLCLVLADAVLILSATQVSSWLRVGMEFAVFSVHTGATVLTLCMHLIAIYIFDLYNTGRDFRTRDALLRMGLAVGLAGVLSAMNFYSLPSWKFGRGILLLQLSLIVLLLATWRYVYSSLARTRIERQEVIIVGAGRAGRTLYDLLSAEQSLYRVVGFLDDDPGKSGQPIGSPAVLGKTKELIEVSKSLGVRTAILAVTHDRPSELVSRILQARLSGMNILDMPTVFEQLTGRVPVEHIADQWLLFADGFHILSKEYVQKVKRLIDFGMASLLLLVSFPGMILTALAIRLESSGPIFYHQDRVGVGGSVFTVWKFRSMRVDAEQNGAVWAQRKDARVTRVGKWIRLLRIDELPQLFNVFRGEMSLVGPRPERPEFVSELSRAIPYYAMRHAIRPGITGWAQVNYRYGASIEDALFKLEYDLYYIKNMSLLLDIKILLRTIGVVLFREGSR